MFTVAICSLQRIRHFTDQTCKIVRMIFFHCTKYANKTQNIHLILNVNTQCALP